MAWRERGKAIPGSTPWPKGVSGNPGGKPKGIDRQIREKYGKDAVGLVGVLIELAMGRTPDGYEDVEIKTSDRIKACGDALDRIAGKPHQSLEISEGAESSHVDWSVIPLERRRELMTAALEIAAIVETVEPVGPLGGDTEH